MFKELIIEKRQLCLNSIHENSLTKRRIYEVTWADYIRDFMYIQDTNYTNYVNITNSYPRSKIMNIIVSLIMTNIHDFRRFVLILDTKYFVIRGEADRPLSCPPWLRYWLERNFLSVFSRSSIIQKTL